MRKGPGLILGAVGAWALLLLGALAFSTVMTIGMACHPWTMAWRAYAGPETAPACPFAPDPWAVTPTIIIE